MKKTALPLLFFLLLTISCFFISCTGKKAGSPVSDTSCISQEDAAKLKAWDKLFPKNQPHADTGMLLANKSYPVKHNLALGCIKAYEEMYYNNIKDTVIKHAYTYGVNFSGLELSNWLLFASQNINYTDIRVSFGVYTHDYVAQYPSAKEGRLTVFLWPYQNGKPSTYNRTGTIGSGNNTTIATQQDSLADPFNLGNVYP